MISLFKAPTCNVKPTLWDSLGIFVANGLPFLFLHIITTFIHYYNIIVLLYQYNIIIILYLSMLICNNNLMYNKIREIFMAILDFLFNKRYPKENDLFKDSNDDRFNSDSGIDSDYKVWLADAENIFETENIKMRTRGEYENGYPEGLIIHYTAGRTLDKHYNATSYPVRTHAEKRSALEKMARKHAINVAKEGTKNGYNFLVMDIFGNIYQSRPLTKFGYHAGKSYHVELGYSVSKKLTGVEILNAGLLTNKNGNFYTWYGEKVNADNVREQNNMFFMKYTKEQEDALKKLCINLHKHSPLDENGDKVFKYKYVLGHSEVAPNRKTDPMGALSTTVSDFRNMLQGQLA